MPTPTAPSTSGRRRRPGARVLLGIGVTGAAGIVAACVGFVRFSAAGQLFSEEDVPAAPVALVLGAAVSPDGTPSGFLAGRLELARRLYTAGKVEVLLVSGDNLAPEYNEPEAMRSYLLSAGVPAARVVPDYAGFDTYDSCARAKRIFDVPELIVVTQGYHLPRAVATCRRLGITAYGVGDESARRHPWSWRTGALRDQLACVKTVIDLATRRDPVLGPRQTGVAQALRA